MHAVPVRTAVATDVMRAPARIVSRDGRASAWRREKLAGAGGYSASVSSDALPPAAVVLTVSVRSLANFSR